MSTFKKKSWEKSHFKLNANTEIKKKSNEQKKNWTGLVKISTYYSQT